MAHYTFSHTIFQNFEKNQKLREREIEEETYGDRSDVGGRERVSSVEFDIIERSKS